MQLIANQQNIETQFASRRLQNLFRINALEETRLLKKLMQDKAWLENSETFRTYKNDLRWAKRICQRNHKKEDELTKCETSYSKEVNKKSNKSYFPRRKL